MAEQEQFQYVVSREDYSDFKTSQAKCQQLTQLLAQSENLHFQDKQNYLFKIDQLQDQLKAYKNSIRQYVDKSVKQVDDLLKILHQYKSLHSKSCIDEKTFKKIKSESDKIAQTFDVSLKNLQILNSQVMNVIKNLVQDSLALQQKLKEFSQRYENAQDEKETLYEKVRNLNEKAMFLEKEKVKLENNEQKLTNQNQLLKIHLKQEQDQHTQQKISFETTKNKLNSQIKRAKEEIIQNEKKWKERLQMNEKKTEKEIAEIRNENMVSTMTIMEEIERFRLRCEGLSQDCRLKQNNFKRLQIAYKQQSDHLTLQKHKAHQKQLQLISIIQQLQTQINSNQKLISNYQNQIHSLNSTLESNQTQIHSLNSTLESNQTQIHSLNSTLESNQTQIHSLNSTLESNQTQIHSLNSTLESIQTQLNSLNSTLESNSLVYQNQIHQLQDSLVHQTSLVNNLTTELTTTNQIITKLQIDSQNTKETLQYEKNCLIQTNNQLKQQVQQKQLQITSWSHQLQILKKELQECMQKNQLQSQFRENHEKQSLESKNTILSMLSELSSKKQQIQLMQQQLCQVHEKTSKKIDQLTKTLAISETEKIFLEDNAKSITEQLIILQKTSNDNQNKLKSINQQLSHQIQLLTSNLNKKTHQFQELQKAYTQIKSAKNYAENQIYSLKEGFDKEKKKNIQLKEKLSIVGNQSSILRQTFQESQISNEGLLKEIQQLRNQISSSRQVEEASHLLKMNANTLQTEVERLKKESTMLKRERQLICQELSSAKEEIKFLNDDLNSMKLYIDELEQNLQKLSEEKTALKNQLNLFKQQAEFCKKESIDQLKVIDQLEREVQLSKKQLKNALELSEPCSIVKRSSLSKGEKSYYVKEMIHEYTNEMKKNLEEIGALSHEEVRELIFSQLHELGNFLKKIQKNFD